MAVRSFRFLFGFLTLAMSLLAWAGPERVAWPDGYASTFVRYDSVDKPAGRGPPRVRFFYVNVDALAGARPGESLPDGTILVMEDHLAKLGADDKPVTDGSGRFVPTTDITNVFVQEKRAGWGAEYPQDVRNGDWEYAWFLKDGSPKADAKFDGCFACHKEKAGGQDFNFTFSPFVAKVKR